MKTKYFILLALLIALRVWGADPISIEEFKKMSPMEQTQAISQAPADQKRVLLKIKIHQDLVDRYRGEDGLRREIESDVAATRGLAYIEGLFGIYAQIWNQYLGDVWMANQKAGMTQEQIEAVEEKVRKEQDDAVVKRLPIVHSLAFHMAASPKALEFEKRAEQLSNDLVKEYLSDMSMSRPPIARGELMKLKKQMDQIFEEIKQLPALLPGQAEKEYNEFPEEKIR